MSGDKQVGLRATGTVTLFDGFLTLYQEARTTSPTKTDRNSRASRKAI